MKVQALFEKLKAMDTSDTSEVFKSSGMSNVYEKFNDGFFPVGSGRIDADLIEEIQEGGVMVLGNDWGTEGILKLREQGIKSIKSNQTIRNLEKFQLPPESTFYTNFYLGLRSEESKSAMTVRRAPLKEPFKKFCFDFFKIQLISLDPSTVICLGNAVRRALVENTNLFSEWRPLSKSIKELYKSGKFIQTIADQKLGNRRFILTPHPCYSSNFTEEVRKELSAALGHF